MIGVDVTADTAAFLARVRPPVTPALIVRRKMLMRNMVVMQTAVNAAGVQLRAHGKMHKCPQIAALQVAGGAVGLCCQTVSEAQAYALAGIGDLLMTSPVPAWGLARLASLAQNGTRIGLVADHEAAIAAAGHAATEAGVIIDLLIDVDLGHHRTGCPPHQAARLAALAAATPGLRFSGIQAYLGHLQHLGDQALRTRLNHQATARLSQLRAELRAGGLAPAVITGGGTGTYRLDLDAGVFTELQAGSYALMDAEYLNAGAPAGGEWQFVPALFVAATTVSAWHKTHATCDAGLKAISTDGPMPIIVAGAAAGSIWQALGDEHGAIVHPAVVAQLSGVSRGQAQAMIAPIDADLQISHPADAPVAGQIVWMIPGHVDPTINLYDALFMADEDGVIERWPITARRSTL